MLGRLHSSLKMYFVYLLECKDKSLYTGITTNLKRRLAEHKAGSGGHYTRSRGVNKIIYSEKHLTRGLALKREAEIKSWPRAQKLALYSRGHAPS